MNVADSAGWQQVGSYRRGWRFSTLFHMLAAHNFVIYNHILSKKTLDFPWKSRYELFDDVSIMWLRPRRLPAPKGALTPGPANITHNYCCSIYVDVFQMSILDVTAVLLLISDKTENAVAILNVR
jgi:hypothetical protein